MINIDEINKQLESYSEEEQKIFLSFVTPFLEFTDYMKENYGKTPEDIENESAKLSEEVLPEYLMQMSEIDTEKTSPIEFMTQISGKIYRRYAESFDYEKGEEVEKALTKYMEMLLKQEMSKKKKK